MHFPCIPTIYHYIEYLSTNTTSFLESGVLLYALCGNMELAKVLLKAIKRIYRTSKTRCIN